MKRKLINIIQKCCILILAKTKYELSIEHDCFDIEVCPVGIGGNITRYDFICKNKKIGRMNSISLIRFVKKEDTFECPNKKTIGVILDDIDDVINLQEQYNKIIKEVIRSAKISLK